MFALLAVLGLSLTARCQARLVLQPGPTVGTLAGSGADGQTTPGAAAGVSLGSPSGIAYDAAGNLYLADSKNHRVSRLAADGTLTIVAGTGAQGFSGDGGPASAAQLNSPGGICFDGSGRLLIADTGNHRIRRVNADGTLVTIAGTGVAGFSGDGGAATAAALRQPLAVVAGAGGDLFIADAGNHRIRHLLADGTITTIAGNGSEGDAGDGGPALAASLEAPSAMVLLADGRLLIADRAARRLRAVDASGNIAAYALGSAALRRPDGLGMDAAGDVYLADSAAQTVLEGGSAGVGVIAGNGQQGRLSAGSPYATPLDTPGGVAVSAADGSVAVSDRHNHQVQRISLPSLAFGSVPAGKTSASQPLVLQNGGMTALQVTAISLPAGFLNSGGTCQAVPFSLAASATCTLMLAFAPSAQGLQTGVAQVLVSGAAPGAVLLSGTGIAGSGLAASATSLSANGSVSYAGAPVTFTATVTGVLPSAPGGSVVFLDGSTTLATLPLAAGTAALTTSSLMAGQHTVTASYSGDAVYNPSSSGSVTDTVVPTPDFTFSAAGSSYTGKAGGSLSMTFAAMPLNGTLNQPLTLAVTGLPSGSTANFLPAQMTLTGSGATTTLTVQFPATLSRGESPGTPAALAATLAMAVCVCLRRRRLSTLLPVVVFAGLLLVTGCGGGFRVVNSGGTGGGTYSYNAVVTATTTGVLGETLVHSASVALTVTQ